MRHLALLFALTMPVAALAAEAEPDWRKLALADLEAAYAATRANHPGMYDKANPGFPKLLQKARAEALALAAQARTPAAFEASLDRFKAVLDDGHAGAYANLPEKYAPKIKWPGFVAAWRGDAMYVYKSAEGGPPTGAQILACDKVPVRTLVKRNVFGFADGARIPGNWWATARRIFVDDGNPFVQLPKTCQFKVGSKTEGRMLSWSVVPDYYQEWRNGSANGDLLPIGLTERAPGLFWFALPEFSPDDAGTQAYKKLYADTQAMRPKLLSARAVVLDLRFNNGGSSNWSKMLAEHLWGEARVTAALKAYFKKTQTWWRPTAANLSAIKEFVGLLES